MIATGAPAPDFTLPALVDGAPGEISLRALRGQWVVLYFYPRDDTPGCTLEAQDFTRVAADLAAETAQVIGVSRDDLAAHARFCAKHGLGIVLASDAQGDTCERYGVWGEKAMYGKRFMGITRATFLIDPQGRVAAQWPKVTVAGHAEAVLAAVRAARLAQA